MAEQRDWVRVEMVVEYPLGPPESYGGETDPDKQIKQEEAYLNDEGDHLFAEGDYLFAVVSSDLARTYTTSVSRVKRPADD